MSNVEGMYSIYFYKMMERSDSTLRNSIFVIRYSAVHCLIQTIEAARLTVVSYKVSGFSNLLS